MQEGAEVITIDDSSSSGDGGVEDEEIHVISSFSPTCNDLTTGLVP